MGTVEEQGVQELSAQVSVDLEGRGGHRSR